jgi:hypothetical protein
VHDAQKKAPEISPLSKAATASPGRRQGARITKPLDQSLHPTNPREQGQYLAQAWAEFVHGAPWDWWVTLTFAKAPHPEQAHKAYRLWIHEMNRRVFGINYWKKPHTKGVWWTRATEYQTRGAVHYHALLGGTASLDRFEWMRRWEQLAGYARIFPYGMDGKTGAEYYLAKSMYAFKRGEVDVDGPLESRMNQRAWPFRRVP